MNEIYLLTENEGKLTIAQSVFSKFNITLKQISPKYPEIQADTSLEVARYAALEAAKTEKVNVIREDHALFLDALGFPGPYTKFIEHAFSVEKLIRIIDSLDNRTGHFEISAVYARPDGKFKEYSYTVPISISKEPRGSLSGLTGWNRALILEGETRTFAEYDEKDRLNVWAHNFERIAKDIIDGVLDRL